MPTLTKSPSHTSYTIKSPVSSAKSPRGYGHGRHSNRESEVMIIGYGYGNELRRGSVTSTVSDAGSDDSALSSIAVG